MSKRLKVSATFNGEPVPSFQGVSLSISFPHDRAGIASSANAAAHVALTTDATKADDLPVDLVQDAIDVEDEGELVVTENLPGQQILNVTLSRFVIESTVMASVADGNLSMSFQAIAPDVATDGTKFVSGIEFL